MTYESRERASNIDTPPIGKDLLSLLDTFDARGDTWIKGWIDAHGDTIRQLVQTGIDTITFSHKETDIRRIASIDDPRRPAGIEAQRVVSDLYNSVIRGGIEKTNRIFPRYIEHDLGKECEGCEQQVHYDYIDMDEIIAQTTSNDIIDAISAFIVRSNYLNRLFDEPEAKDLDKDKLSVFVDIYENWIKYSLYLAGRVFEKESTVRHAA